MCRVVVVWLGRAPCGEATTAAVRVRGNNGSRFASRYASQARFAPLRAPASRPPPPVRDTASYRAAGRPLSEQHPVVAPSSYLPSRGSGAGGGGDYQRRHTRQLVLMQAVDCFCAAARERGRGAGAERGRCEGGRVHEYTYLPTQVPTPVHRFNLPIQSSTQPAR